MNLRRRPLQNSLKRSSSPRSVVRKGSRTSRSRMTAVGHDAIARRNAVDLADLAGAVPGLSIAGLHGRERKQSGFDSRRGRPGAADRSGAARSPSISMTSISPGRMRPSSGSTMWSASKSCAGRRERSMAETRPPVRSTSSRGRLGRRGRVVASSASETSMRSPRAAPSARRSVPAFPRAFRQAMIAMRATSGTPSPATG